jgi:hypothetical protein
VPEFERIKNSINSRQDDVERTLMRKWGKYLLTLCFLFPLSMTFSLQLETQNTASTKKPDFLSISPRGGPEIEAAYEIRFTPGTFQALDSEVVAVYDHGTFKYKLIPEKDSNIAGGIAHVKIPRLKIDRNVGVFLRNRLGVSLTKNVILPLQSTETGLPRFECVNCSHVFGNGVYNDAYSVKHTNSGVAQINGTDVITISPPNSGVPPCNSRDFIYAGSRASWLDPQTEKPVEGHGTVTVVAQPPVNALLRAPNHKVTLNWTLPGKHGDRFYQVFFEGAEILGVCPERVVP